MLDTKIKSEQHDDTYDLTSFIANLAAQMLKNISNLVCLSMRFPPWHFKQYSATLTSKYYKNFVLFLLHRPLKNSCDNKSMRVTSLSTC